MRNIFLIATLFTFNVFQTSAQNIKFAHVDYLAVIDSLPSKIEADKEIKKFLADGEKTITGMETELQAQIDAYLAEKETLSTIMQELKEKQIQEQNQILDMKRQSLQQDLEVLNGRYYNPIEKRLKNAIDVVAKRDGINYVLNKETLLFINGGTDLTKKVKAEMVKMEAAAKAE